MNVLPLFPVPVPIPAPDPTPFPEAGTLAPITGGRDPMDILQDHWVLDSALAPPSIPGPHFCAGPNACRGSLVGTRSPTDAGVTVRTIPKTFCGPDADGSIQSRVFVLILNYGIVYQGLACPRKDLLYRLARLFRDQMIKFCYFPAELHNLAVNNVFDKLYTSRSAIHILLKHQAKVVHCQKTHLL